MQEGLEEKGGSCNGDIISGSKRERPPCMELTCIPCQDDCTIMTEITDWRAIQGFRIRSPHSALRSSAAGCRRDAGLTEECTIMRGWYYFFM